MSPRRVILVDDERAAGLGPLASTRPTFAIRCGLYTPLERYLASPDFEVVGLRVRPELADVTRELAPHIPVNPAAVSADDEIDGRTIDFGPLGGGLHTLERPWHVVDRNGAAVAADIRSGKFPQAELPTHATAVGPAEDLFLDPSATVNPFAVFDTTAGPIYVGPDAVIDSFSKIEGPAAICEGGRILSARIRGGTTVGPHCRVGGEIEASVFQGCSNKYHDGFLGHAFVGEWVNIGAATNNSDLRNDYGDVHVPMAAGDRVEKIATGSKKAGVYLGDHVKTAIGSLFNTGTTVGEMAVVAPGGRLTPKFVPPFSRIWHGEIDNGLDLEAALSTAKTAMGRRGKELSRAAEDLLRLRHAQTAGLRQNVIASRKPEP